MKSLPRLAGGVARRSTARAGSVRKTPLILTITSEFQGNYATFLRPLLRRAHLLLSPPLVEMSLALVGDRNMARLHEQFLGIAGPTDVLTFPLESNSRDQVLSGEVIICLPEARRQAKAEGVLVSNELLLYALHGMLHLCGFDDRTHADFDRMHRTEDEILTRLGVGPVFFQGRKLSAPFSGPTRLPRRQSGAPVAGSPKAPNRPARRVQRTRK